MQQKSKHELMNLINQFSFMVDDIALYLDTHPTCRDGIDAYKHYKMLREEAISDYTCTYGPISKYNVNVDNYWDWVNKPWPWEGARDC